MITSEVVNQLQDGISEIELQHQKMTEYYRQIEELIASGAQDFGVLEAVLEGMILYTISSFDLEEELMKLVRYPETDEHVKCHEMFMRRLSGYRGKVQAGKYAANELMSLLKIWMPGHIYAQDMDLIEALSQLAKKAA